MRVLASLTPTPLWPLKLLLMYLPASAYQIRHTFVAVEGYMLIGPWSVTWSRESGGGMQSDCVHCCVVKDYILTRHVLVTVHRYYAVRVHIIGKKQRRCRWWPGR